MALRWCCLRRHITYSARTRLLACALLVSYVTYYVRDHVVWHLQSHLRDVGPPPDVEEILLWGGDPIEKGNPAWQRADDSGQVFVYAAHYDDVGLSPLIRVIAVALDPLPYFYVTCRYFSRLEEMLEVRNVTGDLMHNRPRNGRTYISAFMECPLSKFDNFLPYAVTVDKGNQRLGYNYMIIHYSPADTPTAVNNSTPLGWSSRITAEDEKGGAFTWSVTRCFPPFQLGFNDHVMLAEAVVFSRLLGVERFFFYLKDAGPRVLTMLKVLEAYGDTVVLPWNIYTEERDLYYAGQFPAINDCLYRHLRSSRFVLFGDVDELFVPRDHSSLTSLLHTQFTQNPECGAFLFLNVFFNLLLPPTKLPSTTTAAYDDQDDVLYPQDGDEDQSTTVATDRERGQPSWHHSLMQYKMLTHTRRHQEILSPGDRSKPAVDPRRVLAGSVHVVETLRPGFESCVMEESLGLLHHYREFSDYLPPESEQTEDFFLWDYLDDALVELDVVMQEYEKLAKEDNQYTLNMFQKGSVYS